MSFNVRQPSPLQLHASASQHRSVCSAEGSAPLSLTDSGANTPHHHRAGSLDSPWAAPSNRRSPCNSVPESPYLASAAAPVSMPTLELVRFRHNVSYDFRKPVSAGARGMVLCKGYLPADVTMLTGGSPTPQPSAHLRSCRYFSLTELAAIGRSLEPAARQLSSAAAASGGARTTALFFGQLGHGLSSAQMLAVVHLLAPDAIMTAPEIHSLGRGMGMGKGSCHARVRSDTLQCAVAADRGCYHDRDGVWIASCEAGRRELFLFEELMKHYANGFATGRPINLMTVSVASNQRLGLPTRM